MREIGDLWFLVTTKVCLLRKIGQQWEILSLIPALSLIIWGLVTHLDYTESLTLFGFSLISTVFAALDIRHTYLDCSVTVLNTSTDAKPR